jgi:serine/threonine protein kinase
MGLIGGSPHIFSHYGTAGLVMSLGAVLARRFVGIALMTDRAARLEKESALQQQRLSEQSRLLTAAGRMAKGDLVSKIAVPEGSELAPLAGALDSMRAGLATKARAAAAAQRRDSRGLNDELRRQIEQRSRRLMEAVARSFGSDSVSAQPATVTVGKRLGDHYQVLATLGRGAMGAVFEVERVTDHRHFAAKILTEARKKTSLLRFAREAQILCRLDHPNLISIVDIDVTKDGVVFLVMELVRGTVLKLRQDRFREVRFAIDVLRQMSAGLAAIHRAGIVHRDLKPANVLLTEAADGKVTVKLADFGISILSVLTEAEQSTPLELDATGAFSATMSVLTPSHALAVRYSEMAAEAEAEADTGALSLTPDAHLTATGVLVGTPMYMAPELANGSKHARPSADLFALGVIAYELLTGEMPFASPVVWAKRPKDVKVSVPFRDHKLALPESLVAMLDRCLHRDPLLRPSAETLHAALVALPPLP